MLQKLSYNEHPEGELNFVNVTARDKRDEEYFAEEKLNGLKFSVFKIWEETELWRSIHRRR